MKKLLILILLGIFPICLTAEEKPNVLLLCVDDLRPELNCFGKSYIQSPNIDALAARGRIFKQHFVQAPTCGASRYALLTGRYGPASNNALFGRAKKLETDPDSVPPSMPAWLRDQGYVTVSVGKVSHHPGGLGGKDWNDPETLEMPQSWDRHLMPVGDWQHPRGSMHGLAHGEIRKDAGAMAVFQAEEGPDEIYPDGLTVNEALKQLDLLTSGNESKPFFLAVGIIRPHLPFGTPAKYLEPYQDVELPEIPHPDKPEGVTTWHKSGEFMKYQRWERNPNTDQAFADEVRRHYAACVTYADAMVGRVLKKLEETGAAENTIVVLWGDHGWHLGEHAVWGKHTLFEESLHSPLIIAHPGQKMPGEATEAIVQTVDIFPTICDLAQLPEPGFVHGKSLVPQLEDPATPGRPAYAYQSNKGTLRTMSHRLVTHSGGAVELYDRRTPDGETKNVAEDQPEVVEEMKGMMKVLQDLRSP